METNHPAASAEKKRMTWVEPELSHLDVKESSVYPMTGGDGYKGAPDCTRS